MVKHSSFYPLSLPCSLSLFFYPPLPHQYSVISLDLDHPWLLIKLIKYRHWMWTLRTTVWIKICQFAIEDVRFWRTFQSQFPNSSSFFYILQIPSLKMAQWRPQRTMLSPQGLSLPGGPPRCLHPQRMKLLYRRLLYRIIGDKAQATSVRFPRAEVNI